MMEIDIVTTKKKLTKSIINQMQELKLDEIDDDVNVLGFVNNFDTNKTRIIIVELRMFDYRIVYWNWRLGTTKLYRDLKRNWVVEKIFKTQQDTLKYFNALQEYKKYSEQIYI